MRLLTGILIGCLLMPLDAESQVKSVQFFVAPNGNDAWSGKTTTVRKKDGPFKTLQRARDAIRELKQKGGGQLKQPVVVSVRGGTYYLKEPLVFTSDDSGTAQCPVVYAAYQNEKPVFSGGRPITGWREAVLNGKTVWKVALPEVKNWRVPFREMWVNGERCQRARHPNKGYLSIETTPDVKPDTPWHEGQTRFQFRAGDLEGWSTIKQAEIVAMSRWVESHLPIESVSESERVVSFRKRSVFQLQPGDPYYIEGVLEALDTPGEWCLDQANGVLYYYPMPDEPIKTTTAIIPRLVQLVSLEGQPQFKRYVEHLTFRGLTFAHSEWWFPGDFKADWPQADVGGFPQAAVGVPGAIRGEGVRHCTFERCRITHIGSYGLELARGCQHNRIVGCEIHDLGAGGIRIGETTIRLTAEERTHDNEVTNCRIYDGGKIFHSAIGVWIGQSFNNRLTHNLIHDFYYTGISIGWTWGYGDALAAGNVVEWNHVHHIGVRSNGDGPILSDMGGIYTLGIQPGTVIRNNRWHDIAGLRYGGWGIYFDEGSSQIVAENNLVYRTTHGGFHQHYGRDNVVRNNIFAFGRDQQIQASRPEPHNRFTFEHNIVYWQEGHFAAGDLSDFHFVFNHNLYWRTSGSEIRFPNGSLADWQTKRMDQGSQIADPLFIAPEKDDFRLKPGSPAFSLGFKPFDLTDAGPF